MHTIELDCAPGMTRPGDLLPAALDGTGITAEQLGDPVSRFFGNWT